MDPARLRRRILARVTPIGDREACVLLGLPPTGSLNVLADMREQGEILHIVVDGHARYPLFQFEADARRVYPVLAAVMAARPPGWSDYRLLHWLVTPYLDLGCTPAEAISTDANAVLSAFGRETEAPRHG